MIQNTTKGMAQSTISHILWHVRYYMTGLHGANVYINWNKLSLKQEKQMMINMIQTHWSYHSIEQHCTGGNLETQTHFRSFLFCCAPFIVSGLSSLHTFYCFTPFLTVHLSLWHNVSHHTPFFVAHFFLPPTILYFKRFLTAHYSSLQAFLRCTPFLSVHRSSL